MVVKMTKMTLQPKMTEIEQGLVTQQTKVNKTKSRKAVLVVRMKRRRRAGKNQKGLLQM